MSTVREAIWFCGVYDADRIVSRLCSDLTLSLSRQERVDERNDAGAVDFCEWRFFLDGLSQTIDLIVDDDGSAELKVDRLNDAEKQLVFDCLSSDPELQSSIVG